MELKVLLHDVRKVEAEALVVGCYEDVRPLKGMAGELDWLLCGALSRLVISRHFTGAIGDSALVTPRGKMRVRKLFMLGLGPRETATAETMRAYARSVARCLLDAGVSNSLIEYIPPAAQEEARHLAAIREGLREGSGVRSLDAQLLVQDALVYERISRIVAA